MAQPCYIKGLYKASKLRLFIAAVKIAVVYLCDKHKYMQSERSDLPLLFISMRFDIMGARVFSRSFKGR